MRNVREWLPGTLSLRQVEVYAGACVNNSTHLEISKVAIEDIPVAELDEPIVMIRRQHRNRMAQLIAASGVPIDRFRLHSTGSRRECEILSYYFDTSLSDPSWTNFKYCLRQFPEAGTVKFFLAHAYPSADGYSRSIAHGDEQIQLVTHWRWFYRHLDMWLKATRQCYDVDVETRRRAQADQALPDLWADLWKGPEGRANQGLEADTILSHEQVGDITRRLLATVDSIPASADFTEEMRQVFREELVAHLPKAGERWAPWRDAFIGWGMGKVLDGMLHSIVLRNVVDSIWGFVAGRILPLVPPQLLP